MRTRLQKETLSGIVGVMGFSTQEDFAETFMYYIKYKGKVPLKWSDNRAIQTKWSFIDDLCVTISKQMEQL